MGSKVGEYTEAHLLKVAKEAVLKKTKDSVVLDTKAEDRIPKFDAKGEQGERLGGDKKHKRWWTLAQTTNFARHLAPVGRMMFTSTFDADYKIFVAIQNSNWDVCWAEGGLVSSAKLRTSSWVKATTARPVGGENLTTSTISTMWSRIGRLWPNIVSGKARIVDMPSSGCRTLAGRTPKFLSTLS